MADTGRIGSKVDLVVFDFDGVLTDNRVLVTETGVEAVFCSRADGLAFDMLRAAGIPALIVSTERNPVVSMRAAKLRVPVLQSVKNKADALATHCREAGIGLQRTIFVGNDLNDLGVMKLVGFPVAVADAHPAVKAIARIVLSTRGGDGAARELVEHVMGIAYCAVELAS